MWPTPQAQSGDEGDTNVGFEFESGYLQLINEGGSIFGKDSAFRRPGFDLTADSITTKVANGPSYFDVEAVSVPFGCATGAKKFCAFAAEMRGVYEEMHGHMLVEKRNNKVLRTGKKGVVMEGPVARSS